MAYDPFDDPIDNNDSPRSAGGRPRSRDLRDRGANGRPRVRPINDSSARRRGRPQIDVNSIADQISREAIVSGQISAKAIDQSVRGLQSSISVFQKTIVNPLAKSVNNFSQSITRFNNEHQQYLKQQTALAKEIYETFRNFRRIGIDPIIRGAARSQVGISSITQVMKEINREKYQGKDYEQMISNLSSIDRKLNRFVTGSVAAVEVQDTFLKEYHRSSKGTSKFLNAVTYAAEDIAEDINTLKADLNKYLRGKNSSRTVLQDQSESLRRIESNTKGMGIVVASSLISGLSAVLKTAFTFNKYMATDTIANLLGRQKGLSAKATAGPGGKFVSKILGSQMASKAKTSFQEASLQGSPFAEGVERVGRRFSDLKGLGKSIADAWNESKVKWFWDIGVKMIADRWEKQGALGVSIVSRVRKAYARKNYKGPHPTSRTTFGSNEEALRAVQRLADKIDRSQGAYGALGDFESDNYAQLAFTPEQMRTLHYPSRDNVIRGRFGEKKSNVIKADFTKGTPQRVTINPESNTKMTSVETGTAERALASLNRINLRILGYLQRVFKHVKHVDENTDELEGASGKTKVSDKSGLVKLLGGAALAIGGRKALIKYGALRAGWAGKALGLGSKAKFAKTGATSRVLWDTFGFGNAKKGTGAIGLFKKTKLGQSGVGRFIRQLRVANAGFGTGAESRIARGMLTANRWGGIFDPLGAGAGFLRGAGKARQATGLLGASGKSLGALGKAGLAMDKAGAAIVGAGKGVGSAVSKGATAAGNWLGGLGKVGNLAKAGVSTGLLGGLGKAAGALLKKVPIIGGLFTLGLGIKELVKDHDWKNGLWHILTGTLMAVPVTSLAGTILSIGGDVAKFGFNKFKSNKAKQDLDEKSAGKAGVAGAAESSPAASKVITEATGQNYAPSSSNIDHYSGTASLSAGYSGNKAKAIDQGVQQAKQKNAQKAADPGYGFFGKATKAIIDRSKATATSLSQTLASASERIVGGNRSPQGICAKRVADAMEASGIRVNRKASAYMYGDYLASRDDMQEVKYSPSQLASAPRGAIVVWGKGSTPHGHISIADGKGNELSDYIGAQRVKTSRRDGLEYGQPRVFIPGTKVASAKPVTEAGGGLVKSTNLVTGRQAGAGESTATTTVIQQSAGNSAQEPNSTTIEISPIIQDYGLAIINNLLFS